MADPFSSLTLYRLRNEVDGHPTTKFHDFIDPERTTTVHGLKETYDFQARLFVAPPEVGPPAWLEPLKAGFGELKGIPDSLSNSAVLIIKVKSGNRTIHFASTFGLGRFLLGSGTWACSGTIRAHATKSKTPSGFLRALQKTAQGKSIGF
jgi:hypothetical protein